MWSAEHLVCLTFLLLSVWQVYERRTHSVCLTSIMSFLWSSCLSCMLPPAVLFRISCPIPFLWFCFLSFYPLSPPLLFLSHLFTSPLLLSPASPLLLFSSSFHLVLSTLFILYALPSSFNLNAFWICDLHKRKDTSDLLETVKQYSTSTPESHFHVTDRLTQIQVFSGTYYLIKATWAETDSCDTSWGRREDSDYPSGYGTLGSITKILDRCLRLNRKGWPGAEMLLALLAFHSGTRSDKRGTNLNANSRHGNP